MLNLEALRSSPLQTEPYEWAYVTGALDSPDDAEALRSTWPSEDFWTIAGSDEKSYSWAARPLITMGADRPARLAPLPPAWQGLAEDLLSPDYRDSLSQLTGIDLAEAEMEASLRRWDRDAHLGAHRDLPEKILTHILYMGQEWDLSWGGCLRILGSADEDDVAAELPPRLNTSSVLVRGERSWHSVTPVHADAAEPRRSLTVIWFVPGSASPAWSVSDDGTVTCPGAVREDAGPVGRAAHRARLVARRTRGRKFH